MVYAKLEIKGRSSNHEKRISMRLSCLQVSVVWAERMRIRNWGQGRNYLLRLQVPWLFFGVLDFHLSIFRIRFWVYQHQCRLESPKISSCSYWEGCYRVWKLHEVLLNSIVWFIWFFIKANEYTSELVNDASLFEVFSEFFFGGFGCLGERWAIFY